MDCCTQAFPVLHYLCSLFKLVSIESVMPSNHSVLCHPLLLCLQSFPASGSFPMSQLFESGSQSSGASALASVFPMSVHGWFPLGLTRLSQGTLKSLLQHHSLKASILWHSAFFMVQLSHPYMTTGKTIALTRWTSISKEISLLSNILSRFVIAFLLSRKYLLISRLQSLSTVILEPKKIKSVTVFIFSHIFAMKWWDWMLWPYFFEYWVLSQLIHSPLLPSSRSSLAPLHFLPLVQYHLHIWSCWYFSQQSWFQLVIHPAK